MANSIISICNRALSEIGTRSTIASLEEGSPEATQCALWYDNLRQQLLRTANWGFARFQLSLTQLGDLIPDETSPYPWAYKYAYPSDCIKMRYILAPPPSTLTGSINPPTVGQPILTSCFSPSRANRFIVANDRDNLLNQRRLILSNVYQAIGAYTGDVTDPSLFDTLFDGALTAALAYKLVIPLSGNVGLKKDFGDHVRESIVNARVADGNEAISKTDHTVDWIATRGLGSIYGYGPLCTIGCPTDWGDWWGGNDNWSWGM